MTVRTINKAETSNNTEVTLYTFGGPCGWRRRVQNQSACSDPKTERRERDGKEQENQERGQTLETLV